MKQEYFDIEQIDRYLEKQMSGEELKQYEIGLAQSPELQSEVTAYKQLIDGLHTLGSATFQQKVEQWENEWVSVHIDDTELIEWYLNKELAKAGDRMVEGRIKDDPVFAKAVEDQQSLLDGFAMVKSENFIQQLEKNTTSTKSDPVETSLKVVSKRKNIGIIRRLAAAILVIVVLGSTLYWYASQNYSSSSITASLYEAPRTEQTMGDAEDKENLLVSKYMNAHELMAEQQYDEAFLAFNRLLDEIKEASIDDFNRQYLTEETEWNRLLAAQAMSTPPVDVEQEAKRIANQDGHGKKKEALQLLERIHSFWYRIVN
jgi:hypothetical protein